MSALEAARLGDQIGHTSAMKGLIAGLVIGFIVTAVVLVAVGATVATGGAAAVVIGALIAGTAGGGLAGMKIGATFDSDPKGPINTGSPNTFLGTGRKPAARATLDTVLCADHTLKLIAQGSTDVFINNAPSARRSDATVCSAKIREGQPDVFFGGPTGTYLEMEAEVPGWLVTTLNIAMWVGAGIATAGAAVAVGIGAALVGAGASLLGGWAGTEIGGSIGERFGGARGRAIGEAIGGFGGALLGGFGAGKLLGGGKAPVAAKEVPVAPRAALATPKGPAAPKAKFGTPTEAPAVRPNTSNAKYGPDSRYQKADGSWEWPPNDGFAGPRATQTLPVGSRIDRFGHPGGKYLSPEGTPFTQRALAPKSLNDPYYAYRVAKPLEVQSGKIAPAFDQPGGGTQYNTAKSVQQLINEGYLVPIDP